jgi:electron transfer flavoprotein alpha subunit
LYFLETLYQIITQVDPDVIVFGHTYETRDWVPRLSAKLDIPFISDCTGFKYSEQIELKRPIYQAKLIQKLLVTSNKVIISFQAGSYSIDDLESGNCQITDIEVNLSSVINSVQPGEKFQESSGGVDLTAAECIVSIGRGISKEENIPIAEKLANKINAQIGSSRPVVDAGWLDHSRQIGSSGQTVSPKLYFALGISGAIQHLVGMKGSKQIIAINKDSNAPIFEIADYAVIGDLLEIIPKLTENL